MSTNEYQKVILEHRNSLLKIQEELSQKTKLLEQETEKMVNLVKFFEKAIELDDEIEGEGKIKVEENIGRRKEATESYKKKMKVLANWLATKLDIFIKGKNIPFNVYDEKTGELIIPIYTKVTRVHTKKIACDHRQIIMDPILDGKSNKLMNNLLDTLSKFNPRFSDVHAEWEKALKALG
jgi:hypothetical protein